jgi:molybdenum cofactor synthesis domain-containing protein
MVGILLVGDEILSGSVREENLPVIVGTLAEIGYEVGEVRIVRDDIDEIADAMRELHARYEYVISAGGVGPTHDDVTIDGVGRALSVPLVANATMNAFLVSRYGKPLAPMVARMADLPEGTEVLGCEEGRWPLIRVGTVFLLPGLPVALVDKMARIKALLPPRPGAMSAEIYLSEDESEFADWLDRIHAETRSISIGSYPVVGAYDYRSRIVVRGLNRADVERAARAIERFFLDRGSVVRVGGLLERDSK